MLCMYILWATPPDSTSLSRIVVVSGTLPALARMLWVGDSLRAHLPLDGGLTRLRYLPSNVTAVEDRITWQGMLSDY